MREIRTSGSVGALGGQLPRATRPFSVPTYFDREIAKYSSRWPFLKFGLFNGSLERLQEVKLGFDEAIVQVRFELGI